MGKMPAILKICIWEEQHDFSQVFNRGTIVDVTGGKDRSRFTTYVVTDVLNNAVHLARRDALEKDKETGRCLDPDTKQPL